MKAKTIGRILEILILFLFAWLAVSYADVLRHNLHPNPVYPAWNLFNIVLGG